MHILKNGSRISGFRTYRLGDWIRTSDHLHPMQVRYQAAPHPEKKLAFSLLTLTLKTNSFTLCFVQFLEPACRGEFLPRTIRQTYTFTTFFLTAFKEIQKFMKLHSANLHLVKSLLLDALTRHCTKCFFTQMPFIQHINSDLQIF